MSATQTIKVAVHGGYNPQFSICMVAMGPDPELNDDFKPRDGRWMPLMFGTRCAAARYAMRVAREHGAEVPADVREAAAYGRRAHHD